MRHIVIGDIHGRDNWRHINIKLFDKIIFLGDYVDSKILSDLIIYENLKDIIALKKQLPEKVVLLLGNHDAYYFHYPHFKCSDFRPSMQKDLTNLFRKNADLFQIAYQKGKCLFTHAGITNSWYKEVTRLPEFSKIREQENTLADQLNRLERTNYRETLYDVGIERGGMGYGGPLWADIKETFSDTLTGYLQMVGHTRVEEIRTISYQDRSITYCDVLSTREQFYQIDI